MIVNNKRVRLSVRSTEMLSDVLREKLGLTATKIACGEGTCGSCTALIDGKSVYSCLVLALDCEKKSIETVEGLSQDPENLHPIQQAFVTTNSSQCGFCTPGMIVSAMGLLRSNPDPLREDVKVALSGNTCRCTDYTRYIDAVLLASKEMRKKEGQP